MAFVSVLARDRRYAQLIALTAEECGHRVAVTDDERALPLAAFYFIDADDFSARPADGRIIYYGNSVKKPPFYSEDGGRILFWHRPFSLSHLTAVLLNLPLDRGLTLLSPDEGVRLDGCVIRIGKREYALLSALYARRGEAVTAEELMRAAWGESGDKNLLRVSLFHLKKKLTVDGKCPLRTVRGVGYLLERGETE